ncbi:hypothetical protein [Bifidobacterium platyrrhinorum]|uniref:Uncharacterized protein n=1 Tax=Bifidobacterium platyrrhinorum TaxID=2661628 RepID=A0A6L9SUA5_9BIFI|nr:hypothetical protein [Bifidobacterium platyrrhinorum]NEG55403.1 hypothetical protein [Bifidobacterium platyrrhinorum]
MADLVLGGEKFRLSDDEVADTLERRISEAFKAETVIEVAVVVDRNDVSLTVNPKNVPYWYVLDVPSRKPIRVY